MPFRNTSDHVTRQCVAVPHRYTSVWDATPSLLVIDAIVRAGPDCGDPVVQDLYRTICRISYMGDIRMGIAEDADKVDRIVAGSYSSFESLYGRRMIQGRVAESAQLARSYTGSWRQTPSRAAHLQMTSELPMVSTWSIT